MAEEQILTNLIRKKSAVSLQNCFMRLSDKEVAVSLRLLDEEDREKVLGLIPSAKKERVRTEIRMFKRQVRVSEAKRREIMNHVIAVLEGRSRGNVSSYVKPKKA